MIEKMTVVLYVVTKQEIERGPGYTRPIGAFNNRTEAQDFIHDQVNFITGNDGECEYEMAILPKLTIFKVELHHA